MKTAKLSEVLDQQYRNLKKLLEVVKKKQRALVERNIEALEECIRLEERILLNIQSVEKKRYEIINGIIENLGLKENDFGLSSILLKLQNRISKNEFDQLTNFEKDIKETAFQITGINERNKFLIQHSRQFINETINTVLNSKKDSILDRKG